MIVFFHLSPRKGLCSSKMIISTQPSMKLHLGLICFSHSLNIPIILTVHEIDYCKTHILATTFTWCLFLMWFQLWDGAYERSRAVHGLWECFRRGGWVYSMNNSMCDILRWESYTTVQMFFDLDNHSFSIIYIFMFDDFLSLKLKVWGCG